MELELEGVKLKVYESGEIYRLYKKGWLLKKGSIDNYGYRTIKLNNKSLKQHRIVYKAFNPDWKMDDPKQQIDHINRIKNDNRIINLRIATSQQNQQNTNTKGYCWCNTTKRWRAFVKVDGKYYCKYSKTEEEAIKTSHELRTKYYEFYERTLIPDGE